MIKNLPKKIYLQIGEDCECDDWNKIYPSHEVTWCKDKINDNDLVYTLEPIKPIEVLAEEIARMSDKEFKANIKNLERLFAKKQKGQKLGPIRS